MQSLIIRMMHLNNSLLVKMDVIHLVIEIMPWLDVVVVDLWRMRLNC